nr:hypothetical protein [Tanacetum cinerariifolium]
MALDKALVASTNRLKIGKGNQRLSPDLKSNEATIQVVLDALKLTPLNEKSHTLNMENFRDVLNICPRLPMEIFQDPIVEEEILSFLSDLGHSGDIRVLTDVNVNSMHQPWRSFAAIINMCLSGKTTTLDNDQLKLVTKRSKKDFHILHASGSGVHDVPKYESKSDMESWRDSEEEGDDDDDSDDDEGGNDDEGDDVAERNADAEMTDADQGTTKQHVYQEEEDAHVTLTHVHDVTKADE